MLVIQLCDFEKILEFVFGESEMVEFMFMRKDLSVWDVVIQDWVVLDVDGVYKVWIGVVSDNLGIMCNVDGLECESGVVGFV